MTNPYYSQLAGLRKQWEEAIYKGDKNLHGSPAYHEARLRGAPATGQQPKASTEKCEE